jgi:membrane protein implicated in regulation of membrane protease activity
MTDSVIWAAIWLAAAATFGMGEILIAGSFFLAPFAAGALAAAVVSLLGSVLLSWVAFLVVSMGAFFAMRPLANRLDANAPDVTGIGANRLIGTEGIVLTPIPGTPGDAGMVRVATEEWRADTRPGVALAAGTKVRIIEVQGTRLLVEPVGIDDVVF